MRNLTNEAAVSRWCAAPRDAILAWERDPYAAASIYPKMRVENLVPAPEGVGTRWRAVITVGGVLRIRQETMLMALDPVIIEGRNSRVAGRSTTTVSADPDDTGRFLVTFAHENVLSLPPLSYAYYGRRSAALQRNLERTLGDYADKTVAAIEARSRAAGAATGRE